MKYIKALFIFSLICVFVRAQKPTPAPVQNKTILIKNGMAHIGNGQVIQNSYIGFKDGKLTLVADATTSKIDPKQFDEVIDASGKHVYPGFISPNSTIGLVEIGAVRATNDVRDVGKMIPNVRSLIAYNTDSKIIPTVRTNGVLIAQVCPRGGRICGTSSVFNMDGWNWEDAVLKQDDGIHMNWPAMVTRGGWWAEPGQVEKNKNYDNEVNELKKFFADAKSYAEVDKQPEKNLYFEAMRGLFNGKQTLFVSANGMKEISETIFFCKKNGVQKLVIVGGRDAWMVTSLLKENNVSVIVSRVHDLPDKPEDDIDMQYKIPTLLKNAGVLYCLDNSGDMEQIHVRNLPFMAGNTVPYGLTKEEALMSITGNAAKILGIDKVCGTLEEGKYATLFISAGDALDVLTNNVSHAFIQGRKVDLQNEQTELYNRFMKKYGKQ